MGDIGAVAELVSKIFGFVVDPDKWATMKREHRLEVLHAAYKIALDTADDDAADRVLDELRELSKRTGP